MNNIFFSITQAYHVYTIIGTVVTLKGGWVEVGFKGQHRQYNCGGGSLPWSGLPRLMSPPSITNVGLNYVKWVALVTGCDQGITWPHKCPAHSCGQASGPWCVYDWTSILSGSRTSFFWSLTLAAGSPLQDCGPLTLDTDFLVFFVVFIGVSPLCTDLAKEK